MPQTPHVERQFSGSQIVRDVVIGMSDDLTVPFALAAALSGVVDSSGIVVTAGLAEIAAGSIGLAYVLGDIIPPSSNFFISKRSTSPPTTLPTRRPRRPSRTWTRTSSWSGASRSWESTRR